VIIGNSKDGLPIILGNVDSPAAPGTAAVPLATDKKTSADGALKLEALPAGVPVLDKKPAADQAATPQDKQATSSLPADLSDIEALLGRITERLRSSGSASSVPAGPPKQ
jgi:hypothetical protein